MDIPGMDSESQIFFVEIGHPSEPMFAINAYQHF
jgi:hypothetical protein